MKSEKALMYGIACYSVQLASQLATFLNEKLANKLSQLYYTAFWKVSLAMAYSHQQLGIANVPWTLISLCCSSGINFTFGIIPQLNNGLIQLANKFCFRQLMCDRKCDKIASYIAIDKSQQLKLFLYNKAEADHKAQLLAIANTESSGKIASQLITSENVQNVTRNMKLMNQI